MSYYYTHIFSTYTPEELEIGGVVKSLRENFKKTKLLICGESHGVQENANIAFTLVKMLGIERLAIERSASNFKAFVDSAIRGQPNFLLPQVLPSLQASMLSVEMLKTIFILACQGAVKEIAYIDLDSSDPAVNHASPEKYMRIREAEIANNIMHLSAQVPTMVILGSYHTRLQTDDVVGKSSLQMVREKTEATYLRYDYLSGEQYNAGRLLHFQTKLHSNEDMKLKQYKVHKLQENNYTIEIPVAHRIMV